MFRERSEAVDRLAAKLFSAERALDLALIEIAELSAEIPRTRMDTGLALCVPQQAVEHMGAALTGMVQVRGAVAAAHEALEQARRRAGLPRVTAVGGGDKDWTGDGTKPPAILREVA